MGLLNKLQDSNLGLKGVTPGKMKSSEGTSHVIKKDQHTVGHTQLEPGSFVKYLDNLPN